MERQRINRFDNLKGFLIILVVFYHVLLRRAFLLKDELLLPEYITSVTASFLMPAFVFVSGLLTSKRWTRGSAEKLISNLFLPFAVFHLLHWVVASRSLAAAFYPSYTTWYLLSLFFWRLLVIPFSRMRFAFPISIALALVCGFTAADELASVSRTVCLFPYFLAGYNLDKEKIRTLGNSPGWKILAVGAMMILFLLVILLQHKGFPMRAAFVMKVGFTSQGVSNLSGFLLRFLAFCVGFILIACLVCLTPDKKCFLTALGKNSMTIYIGHAFIVRIYAAILKKLNIFAEMSDMGFLVFALAVTAVICLLLNSRFAVSAYRRFMEMLTKLLVKNEPPDAVDG